MFSYYGSKTSMVNHYPFPNKDIIIEPFAGAAKYSLKHFEKEIILVDKYRVITDIWIYLQNCSKKDILSLPSDLKKGESIKEIKFDCEAQKNLMGFLIAAGDYRPRNTVSSFCSDKRPKRIKTRLKFISDNLFKIKHWKIINDDYLNIENIDATWFIDPPYQFGGEHYVESNKNINYSVLKKWCEQRKGQVMVCENTKANWMDFNPIKEYKGSTRKTTEAIWTNYKTHYNNIQTSIFDK